MIRNILNFTVQNKNFVMFITSMIYITGIFACFTETAIPSGIIISAIAILAIAKNYISPKLMLFWIFMFYFGFFNATFCLKSSDELYSKAPATITVEGQIVSIPNSNFKDKTKFFFKTKTSKTLVTASSEEGNFSNLKIGNYYSITGKLRIPFEAVNPSQFDYGKYLKNFNTFTVIYANTDDIQLLDKPYSIKWKFLQSINNVRNNILETHSKYLKSPNLEILGGIVFGDDAIAPPDYIKATFVNSGLLHILAASGMNVAFIYGFWVFILVKLLHMPVKPVILSGIGVVILYCLMTGLGASVVRATCMLIFVLVGKLIDRDTHSIALLSFVAMLMLIYNPAYLNDVGFQLSFLVTFGLLTTANMFFEKYNFKNRFLDWLFASALIPIVAQIWVAPLQMFYFNTFSLYSVFANITIVPFLSMISFCGFISSLLAIIKPIANFVCMVFDFVLNPLLNILVIISNYFSNLPHSLLTTTHPSAFQVILYYIIILLLTLLIKIGLTNRKLILYTILSIFILGISTIGFHGNKLEILAFSVQDADAFLIKTPQNKFFIIDTAKSGFDGGKSQAEFILTKYLKDKGIKKIEGMIITHFDNDHSGGAIDLYNSLKIKKTYVNSLNHKDYTSKLIYDNIKNITAIKNKEIIYEEPHFKISVYNAKFPETEAYDNENSILTLLEYDDFKALFMGDAGVEAFKKLQTQFPQNITLLKVGHHGAKNVVDQNMLTHLNPEISLISARKNNPNHPHPLTLNVLRNKNILRTDKHNSIKITSNGKTYNCYSFDKHSRNFKEIIFEKHN